MPRESRRSKHNIGGSGVPPARCACRGKRGRRYTLRLPARASPRDVPIRNVVAAARRRRIIRGCSGRGFTTFDDTLLTRLRRVLCLAARAARARRLGSRAYRRGGPEQLSCCGLPRAAGRSRGSIARIARPARAPGRRRLGCGHRRRRSRVDSTCVRAADDAAAARRRHARRAAGRDRQRRRLLRRDGREPRLQRAPARALHERRGEQRRRARRRAQQGRSRRRSRADARSHRPRGDRRARGARERGVGGGARRVARLHRQRQDGRVHRLLGRRQVVAHEPLARP